ncbi:Protein kinase family protein with leucine-rich repeat domain, partial [Prunus dulcis]
DNSKLLVYEYSDNRSLDGWLHKRNRPSNLSWSVQPRVLDWPKRLHIAVGGSSGPLPYASLLCATSCASRHFGLAKMLSSEENLLQCQLLLASSATFTL